MHIGRMLMQFGTNCTIIRVTRGSGTDLRPSLKIQQSAELQRGSFTYSLKKRQRGLLFSFKHCFNALMLIITTQYAD